MDDGFITRDEFIRATIFEAHNTILRHINQAACEVT